MASAAHDYQHFVRWLHDPATEASDDARRMGNLVLQHFDAISLTSRNRSQRAIRIVELARGRFEETNNGLPWLNALAAGGRLALAKSFRAHDWPVSRFSKL